MTFLPDPEPGAPGWHVFDRMREMHAEHYLRTTSPALSWRVSPDVNDDLRALIPGLDELMAGAEATPPQTYGGRVIPGTGVYVCLGLFVDVDPELPPKSIVLVS